jgi:hypothetical protein
MTAPAAEGAGLLRCAGTDSYIAPMKATEHNSTAAAGKRSAPAVRIKRVDIMRNWASEFEIFSVEDIGGFVYTYYIVCVIGMCVCVKQTLFCVRIEYHCCQCNFRLC